MILDYRRYYVRFQLPDELFLIHSCVSFVIVLQTFCLLRFSFFIWFIFQKEKAQGTRWKTQCKVYIGAGMRNIQECWHGKESNYPSMKVKKVEQERGSGWGREWWDTHTYTRAKPPHSSAALHRDESVSPVKKRHIKEPSQHISIVTPFSGIDAALHWQTNGTGGLITGC